MAQLVARAVRDCEVASSNLVTQTIKWYLPNWRNVPRGKRQFESGHPDHSRRKNKENLFSLFDRRRMERFCESKSLPWNYSYQTSGTSQGVNASSTGRRSERKIKACFYFFERGGTEGFWKNPNLVAQTIQGEKIKKIYFLYLIDAEWKDFAKAKAYHEIILTKIKKDWNDSSLFRLLIIIDLFYSRCHTNLLVCGETLHHL